MLNGHVDSLLIGAEVADPGKLRPYLKGLRRLKNLYFEHATDPQLVLVNPNGTAEIVPLQETPGRYPKPIPAYAVLRSFPWDKLQMLKLDTNKPIPRN